MDRRQNNDNRLVWSALEYEAKERSKDWFWALGIIVVTSTIAAIIFGNYFFAALLLLSGILLAFFAIRKPEMITYELNDKGLQIRNRLYPYEHIKSFWIQADLSGETPVKPILFIHTERAFLPILSIPINETIAEGIHSIFLSKDVAEVKMEEHPSEKIIEMLGF